MVEQNLRQRRVVRQQLIRVMPVCVQQRREGVVGRCQQRERPTAQQMLRKPAASIAATQSREASIGVVLQQRDQVRACRRDAGFNRSDSVVRRFGAVGSALRSWLPVASGVGSGVASAARRRAAACTESMHDHHAVRREVVRVADVRPVDREHAAVRSNVTDCPSSAVGSVGPLVRLRKKYCPGMMW